MTDEYQTYELRRDLAVAEAIAADLRRQIREIEQALDQYDHTMAGESVEDAVRRLVVLAYNADDGTTRLPLDPADARTATLLHAIDTAWAATHLPEGQSPTEYLWRAVRAYMES